MIYVRWFPGDYLRDTIHLSWLEDCAYRRLLDLYYTKGHALTANRKVLYRQVRAVSVEEMAAVESVLEQFFFERRGNVFNSRASKELRRNTEITALRVKAAKAKASKAANALHMQTTSSAIPEPEPEPDVEPPNSTFSQDQLLGSGGARRFASSNVQLPQDHPAGVPLALWQQYKEMRALIHRPILPGSEDHVFAELIDLKAKGGDPVEIITFAVRNSSWKLTLPPNNDHKGESANEKRQRRTKEAAERVLQKSGRPMRDKARDPLPH